MQGAPSQEKDMAAISGLGSPTLVINKIQPSVKSDFLYATTLPNEERASDSPKVAGALVYSKKTLSANAVVPTSGPLFLMAADGKTNFFIDPTSARLSMVAEDDTNFSLYVYDASAKSAEKYSFTTASVDGTSVLMAASDTASTVSTLDLSKAEVSAARDLDGDTKLGAKLITTDNAKDTDTKNGLFHMQVAGQDVYAVNTAFAKAKSYDLSTAALTNSDGSFWGPGSKPEENATFTLRSVFSKGTGDVADQWKVYASTSATSQVTEYTFEQDKTGGKDGAWVLKNDGKLLTDKEFAAIEAASKRDLNNDTNYGAKVNSAVDSQGGLYKVSMLGNDYYVAGKSLVSSAAKPLNLGQAFLNEDGTESWKPEKVRKVNNVDQMRVVKVDQGFDIYVEESLNVFAKYQFDTDFKLKSDRSELTLAEVATAEKNTGRDLSGDGFIGAHVNGAKDAKSNVLYSVDVNGESSAFIRASSKLTVDSKVAKNAVDLGAALKVGEDFWTLDAGFEIKSAYVDTKSDDKLRIIATNGNEIRRYSFDKANNQLIDDESGSLDAKTLAAMETDQKRDLNGDSKVGLLDVKAADTVGKKLFRGSLLGNDFLFVSDAPNGAKDLSQALKTDADNFWTGPQGFTKATDTMVMVKTKDSANADIYEVYSKVKDGNDFKYYKNTFDASFLSTDDNANGKLLSLVDVADAEVTYGRDINGDKSKGAPVATTIVKGASGSPGLYKASIDGQDMVLVSENINLKGDSLGDKVLFGEDGTTPWTTNETLKGIVKNDDGYAIYTKTDDGLNRYQFDNKRVLVDSQKVSASDLVAAENALKKDLDGDTAVGVKIGDARDKVTGLYQATVLGQTYYLEGSDLKSGKAGQSGVSLEKAFFDDENPWKPADGFTIAGMVKGDSDFKIYTYKSDNNVVTAQVTVFGSDHKLKEAATDVDPVNLVDLESTQKRDFNGDGVVGFNLTSKVQGATYLGVSKATAVGNQSFWLAGDNLKVGTKNSPLSLSNALLSDDGSGPWNPKDGETIKAVLNKIDNSERYVYVINANDVFKYTFVKSESGIFKVANGGDSEKISAVDLAKAETAAKKDLNGSGTIGFANVTELKDGQRSTGLVQVTALGETYLVARGKTDKAIDLNRALMGADGKTPWAADNSIAIKGTYQPTDGAFEVYGMQDQTIVRFKFTSADDGTLTLTPKDTVSDYEIVSGISLAEREATAKKDLNGDGTFGFKVTSDFAGGVTQATNGFAYGQAQVDSDADNSKIYIVGKDLNALGATSSKTANASALLDGDKYWKPTDGYTVKSIIQSSTTNTVTLYAQKTEDSGNILTTAYKFLQTAGKWSLSSEESKDSAALLKDEKDNKRDLNGDGSVGLLVGSALASLASNAASIYKATIDNNTYYLLGKDLVSGTITKPIDDVKALLDTDGKTWKPGDGDLKLELASAYKAANADAAIPDGAVYAISVGNDSPTFFGSDLKQIATS